MSTYRALIANPPKLEVKENVREVVVILVSCMCDNRYETIFKKNEEGDFKFKTHTQAYTNFQINYSKIDLEWAADAGKWDEVFSMINSGTIVVEKVRSR